MRRSLETALGEPPRGSPCRYVDFQGSRKTSSIWYAAPVPTGVNRKATALVPIRLVTLLSRRDILGEGAHEPVPLRCPVEHREQAAEQARHDHVHAEPARARAHVAGEEAQVPVADLEADCAAVGGAARRQEPGVLAALLADVEWLVAGDDPRAATHADGARGRVRRAVIGVRRRARPSARWFALGVRA
jgi:hypothetical protein